MKKAVFTVLIVLCWNMLLLADVIHTNDGKKLKGKIVKETDEYVLLKARYGERKVYWDEIDHIERGPVEEDQKPKTRKKKKRLPKPKPKANLESLVEKAANGDASAARKLVEAKRAALVPLAKKIEELDGEKKERLEKLRDVIEEKTRTQKEEADRLFREASRLHKECLAMSKKAGPKPSKELQRKVLESLEAVAHKLTRAFELDPTRNDILESIARLSAVYYGASRYANAAPLLRIQLSVAPGDLKVMGMLATCYVNLKKFKEARKLLRDIITRRPDDSTAWANLGVVELSEKKFSLAIKAFEKAISLGMDNVGVHYNLGIAYKHKKKWDKAIESFQKCLAKDPKEGNALLQLGAIYTNKEQYDKAVEVFERFCKLYPNTRQARKLKKDIPRLKKMAKKQ